MLPSIGFLMLIYAICFGQVISEKQMRMCTSIFSLYLDTIVLYVFMDR